MLPHADTHSRIEHFASRYHPWALLPQQGMGHDSDGGGGVFGKMHADLLMPAAPSTRPSMLPGKRKPTVVAQAAVLLGRGNFRAWQTFLNSVAPAWNTADAT